MHTQSDIYKWLVLTLAALTFTFVVAIQQMSLPVLFDEIAADIGLSLVQVGWIWGIGSVMGILIGIIGGPVGDRFGPRRTLAVACLCIGIAGAARGLSNSFVTLAFTMLATGLAQWSIPMNVHKTCGIWFPSKQLGMANGVVSLGMALGFVCGALPYRNNTFSAVGRLAQCTVPVRCSSRCVWNLLVAFKGKSR